jgi:hypothetical protein
MIDRRGFLRLFGAAAAAAVLDPERLLWVPGQKTIFIPSPRQVMFLEAGRRGGKTAALVDAILKQHYEQYVFDSCNDPSIFTDIIGERA